MTAPVYFGKIKALEDEMATAGKHLDAEDIISYILAGLDEEYNGFVASISATIRAEKSISLHSTAQPPSQLRNYLPPPSTEAGIKFRKIHGCHVAMHLISCHRRSIL